MFDDDIGVCGGWEGFQCFGVPKIKGKKKTRQEFGKLSEAIYIHIWNE